MSCKRLKGQVFIVSLILISLGQIAGAQTSSSTNVRLALDQRIRARADEYDKKLEVLYDQQLKAWSKSFIEERRAAMDRAAALLAKKAAEVNSRKNLNWDEVKSDAEFLEFERQQIIQVLNQAAIRQQMQAWGGRVEEETRRTMIVMFKQLVAEDLGQIFDEKLRGQVVRAVNDIPLDMLLAKNISLRKIEVTINAGLPKVPISREQRDSIVAAARVLATAGGVVIARVKGLPDLFASQVGLVAGSLAGWLVANGVDGLNRVWSDEPDPLLLSNHMESALGQWRDEELLWRLEEILRNFRTANLDTVELIARKMNQS